MAWNADSEPKTPRRAPDFGKEDFDRPEVVRDAFRWLDYSIKERFDELMRAMKTFDGRVAQLNNAVADNQAVVLTDLATIRGVQLKWITKIEVLLDERGLPHERIEFLRDRITVIENETKERKRQIESIRVKAQAMPSAEAAAQMIVAGAMKLGGEVAEFRETARVSQLDDELEKARAHSKLIVAGERPELEQAGLQKKKMTRLEIFRGVVVPIVAALVTAGAAIWIALHH